MPRIIGQSVYDEAQELAKQAWVNNFNRENDKKLGLFGGKIICGICGRNILQVANKEPYNSKGSVRKQAGGYVWKFEKESEVM